MATQKSAAVSANNAYRAIGAFVRKFDVPVPVAVLDQTDVLECIPVFAGETVLDVVVEATTDLDTGTGVLRVNVGDLGSEFTLGANESPLAIGLGSFATAQGNSAALLSFTLFALLGLLSLFAVRRTARTT